MKAADEIQAAIDKLTDLKDRSSFGPWASEKETYGLALVDVNGLDLIDGGGYQMDRSVLNAPDAELIVTLHATIDAQLSLLNDGLNWKSAESYAARLAIAINGSKS